MISSSHNPTSTPPDAPDDPVIRLVDVYKAFGRLRVLEGVSLSFARGRNTVILGPSGAGKSVILKHIVGLLKPDRGEVWFENERVDTASERQLVEIRKKIGFLFQMGALFDSMNVHDNVAFPLVEHGDVAPDELEDRAERVLRMVGLSGIGKKMPADLSGGQRKRVALARAIVLNPEVVVYDEPTTGLDPIRSDVINELIVTLRDRLGMTGVIVTHDMVSANKIADRIVMLYDGKIAADGDPESIRRSEDDLVRRFIRGEADREDLEAIKRGFEPGD